MQRHFPFQHPVFGRKGREKASFYWEETVYFWWWQYLKRNAEYLQTCEKNGNGKFAKLYEDFGDVRGDDFKAWWTEGSRNIYCFAEPPTATIELLSEGDVAAIASEEMLVLAVPLNLPMKHLATRFRQLVSKHHSGERGVRASNSSQARYQVHGKINFDFFKNALAVWDMRQANSKRAWWEIAQALNLAGEHHLKKGDTPHEITAKKNVLAATASRLYRKAREMISNAAGQSFPSAPRP